MWETLLKIMTIYNKVHQYLKELISTDGNLDFNNIAENN